MPDHVDDRLAPTSVQDLVLLLHRGAPERKHPYLEPERPLIEERVLRQQAGHRQFDDAVELLARRRHPSELARQAEIELIVRRGERLDQQPVLRFEVVEDQPRGDAAAIRDVGDSRVGEAAFGDHARRSLEDFLMSVLRLLLLRGGHPIVPLERRAARRGLGTRSCLNVQPTIPP